MWKGERERERDGGGGGAVGSREGVMVARLPGPRGDGAGEQRQE